MDRYLQLVAGSDITTIWTFSSFEKKHGSFEGFRKIGRNSDGKRFNLCVFRNDRETLASLYSGIEHWTEEEIREKAGALYVGKLNTGRYTVFDESWTDWGKVCLIPKDVQDECLRQAAFEEVEEMVKENKVLNTVIETTSYRKFKEDFFCLRFIGYDYNPATHDGSKVYTFMNSKCDLIKVFSPQGFTIDQIEAHRDSFDITLKRNGCYEFQCNDSSFAANSSIIIAFEDEWLRYEDIIEKRKQKEEAKRRQKEIDDIQEKRRNEILFDFTDEAGLKESMQ